MTIQDIKEKLTIIEVLSHYNLKPDAKGGLKCPFHESKPNSRKKTLQIYTDTNRYQCFHADCDAGNGDVIDFIEKMEKCTKHQAIEKAKQLIDPSSTPVRISDARSDGNIGKPHNGERDKAQVPFVGVLELKREEYFVYTYADLSIDILGGIRLEGLDRLRVTLKVSADYLSLRHSLDLYNDDMMQKLVRKVAERLEIGTSKIEKALYGLTDELEKYRLVQIEKRKKEDKPVTQTLTEERRQIAEEFLSQPNLMQRTNELLGQSGIVGEEINRQILWLVYGSRKRPKPLHVICLGASGTGKTYLQEKVSKFVPEEEKFTFTASTENAFYYLEPYDLCHKVVLIEDMDGVQYLLYPLRELQTKQWISKVVPMKDHAGEIKTNKLEIYGPICMSGTTTKERVYEDNANRCLLLHLDNSHEQQEAIMNYQRKLSAGKVNHQDENSASQLLESLQQVLEPIKVINPYAEDLRIPYQCFKPLRTHEHYLQFIETVTWYHQALREEKVNEETGEIYIETTLEDIAIANHLMKEILLTKSDELPKAVREFFEQLKYYLQANQAESFYSKQIRESFRLYPMKLNRYLKTLEQYGYIKRAGGNKKSGYEYEIASWEDYEQLKSGVNVLDELLQKLKRTTK